MADLTASELFDQDALVRLSRRRGVAGMLSVYATADLTADPGLRAVAIDLKNRLAELERNVATEGPPERAQALRATLERLAPELERLTSPQEHGRGRALFAPVGDEGEVIRFASQLPLPTRVVLDDGPFLHPLLELADEGRPTGVALASQQEARLLEWRLGELRELERIESEAVEAPHERSGPVGSSPTGHGGSPELEQRRAREEQRLRRLVELAATAAARHAAELGWERVLVSGGERLTEPLAAALGAAADVEVVRDGRMLTERDQGRLAAVVTARLREHHRDFEARLAREVRAAALAAAGNAAALGLSEVAEALNEGRVRHLIYDPGVRYRGLVGADGRLRAVGEGGPGDGRLVTETRLTERLVERALETGARVSPIEGASADALAEADGIAALLRW